MGDVVNLNRVRKAKKRAEAATAADANRIAHGRTKAEKQHAKAEADLRARQLDGMKLADNEKN